MFESSGKLTSRSSRSSGYTRICILFVLSIICSSCFLLASATSQEESAKSKEQLDVMQENSFANRAQDVSLAEETLANHKMETEAKIKSRHGRQYDGPLSTSGTGSYASVSSDSAYVSQLPVGSGSAPGSSGSYGPDLGGNYHTSSYHDPLSMARGYPGTSHMAPMPMGYPQPMSPISSMFSNSMGPPGGIFGSGSAFPLMGKGFDVSEIVCTAIAVAIGAVIVGAPFILIYLFIMNQMNGGASAMGPNGGAISLTGPTSSTTVSGRKKRHTTFPEALLKQLSPFVNNEQIAHTFKLLMSSMAKYQV